MHVGSILMLELVNPGLNTLTMTMYKSNMRLIYKTYYIEMEMHRSRQENTTSIQQLW